LVAFLLGDVGLASVQAVADVLSLALAFPIIVMMQKKIHQAELALETEE
jgi:hypothetical protein